MDTEISNVPPVNFGLGAGRFEGRGKTLNPRTLNSKTLKALNWERGHKILRLVFQLFKLPLQP